MSMYSHCAEPNTASGVHSIDDAGSEMQATFVARAIEPMQAVPSKFDGILTQ